MSQYELILILDAGVDEVAEKPALDAVVGLRRIIVRSIGQAATDETVRVIAAPRFALPGDGLVARIDAPHVRANRTAQPLGIARSVFVYVSVVVQLVRGDPARRAVCFRRQFQWSAVAPPSADLGGQQLGIYFGLVRLEKLLKSNHVRLDHLEDCEAAIQSDLSW